MNPPNPPNRLRNTANIGEPQQPTPLAPNTALFDPVGGSVSFYDTKVRLVPAA